MTIAIHLLGGQSLITASDTQYTYSSGEKVDSGKIVSFWQANPRKYISIAGAGDGSYIKALSQEILKDFKGFDGTTQQVEERIREIIGKFYRDHVLPLVGKLKDKNVPDYSLLLGVRNQTVSKLWNVEGARLKEASEFDCIGIGSATADALLNRLYPLYPTLDSLAVLMAYAIYRVKSSIDGCGMNTEIRFFHSGGPGIVPPTLIFGWETLFRRYERIERDIFYHAMNFMTSRPEPAELSIPAMPPQMKPTAEIVKEIEEVRAEFAKLVIFQPPIPPQL